MRARVLASLLLLAAPTLGCASVRVEHSWRAPDHQGTFEHVLIIAVGKQPGQRQELERAIDEAFSNVGVQATPSYQLFADDIEHDAGDIAATFDEHAIDSVLLVHLLPGGERQQATSGEDAADFFGEYQALHAASAPEAMSTAAIETNFYVADEGAALVWSGLSATFEPATLDESLESYSQAVVNALLDGGLVRRTVTPGAIEARD